MEERRLLLAVALSLLVLTAWQFLFPSGPPQRRPAATSPGPSPIALPAAPSPARVGASPTPGAAASPAATVAQIADASERRIEVQGPEVAVAFSNKGARLVSWQLKRFRDASGHPEEMVQTIPGGPRALD